MFYLAPMSSKTWLMASSKTPKNSKKLTYAGRRGILVFMLVSTIVKQAFIILGITGLCFTMVEA